MRKHKILFAAAGILLAVVFVLSACAGKKPEGTDSTETQAPKITSLTIGDTCYSVRFTESKISEFTDKPMDYYQVAEGDNAESGTASIIVDPETGEIKSFYKIRPYPCIPDIRELSDEQIRGAVEGQLKDTVDFSAYNTFSLKRRSQTGNPEDTMYTLHWQLKKDLLCNVDLTVTVDKDGFVTVFSKTDACPDSIDSSFLSSAERKQRLEAAICEKMKIASVSQIDSYEIESETLSLYHGKPAIICSVNVIEDGFSTLIVVTVS